MLFVGVLVMCLAGDSCAVVQARQDRYGDLRGQLQNLLYTQSCPMWASVWEPRVTWEGRYDPAAGVAEAMAAARAAGVPIALRGAGMLAFDLLPGVRKAFARHTMGLAGRLPRLSRGVPLK